MAEYRMERVRVDGSPSKHCVTSRAHFPNLRQISQQIPKLLKLGLGSSRHMLWHEHCPPRCTLVPVLVCRSVKTMEAHGVRREVAVKLEPMPAAQAAGLLSTAAATGTAASSISPATVKLESTGAAPSGLLSPPTSLDAPSSSEGARFGRKRARTLSSVYSESDTDGASCLLPGDEAAWQAYAIVDGGTPEGGNQRLYRCRTCDNSYTKPARLRRHLRRHTGSRPFVCSHAGCGQSFARKDHLKRHFLKHLSVQPFRCDVEGCGAAFKDPSHLTRHRRLHDDPNPHHCPKCSTSFRRKNQLKRHLVKDHGESKPFQCKEPFCNKGFLQRASFQRHVLAHSTLFQHVACRLCYCAHTHTLSTETAQYACPVVDCDSAFLSVAALRRHTKAVHPKKKATSGAVFPCLVEGCKRVYMQRKNMYAHVRAFHGEKRFVCPKEGCGKAFAFNKSLQQHLARHQNPLVRGA